MFLPRTALLHDGEGEDRPFFPTTDKPEKGKKRSISKKRKKKRVFFKVAAATISREQLSHTL